MHVLDLDNDGLISAAELTDALRFLRANLDEEDLVALLDRWGGRPGCLLHRDGVRVVLYESMGQIQWYVFRVVCRCGSRAEEAARMTRWDDSCVSVLPVGSLPHCLQSVDCIHAHNELVVPTHTVDHAFHPDAVFCCRRLEIKGVAGVDQPTIPVAELIKLAEPAAAAKVAAEVKA
jgi:hypothetical protein